MKTLIFILVLILHGFNKSASITIPKNMFLKPDINVNEIVKEKNQTNLNTTNNYTDKKNNASEIIKDNTTINPLKEIDDFFKSDEDIIKKQLEILKKYQNKTKGNNTILNETKIIDNNTILNTTSNNNSIPIEEKKPSYSFKQKEIKDNSIDENNRQIIESFFTNDIINSDILKGKIKSMLSSNKAIMKLLSDNSKQFQSFLINHDKLDVLNKKYPNDRQKTNVKDTIEMLNNIKAKLYRDLELYSTSNNSLIELSQKLNDLPKEITLKENNITKYNEKAQLILENKQLKQTLKELSSDLENEKKRYKELEKEKLENIKSIKNLFKEFTKEEIKYANKLQTINKETIKQIESTKELEQLKQKVQSKQEKLSILKDQLSSLEKYYKYLQEDLNRYTKEKKSTLKNFNFRQYSNDEDTIDDVQLTKKILSLLKKDNTNNNV